MVADSEAYLARLPADSDALAELLTYYLEGALRYPRISKAHLHAPLVSDDYGGPFPALMQPVVERLRDELRHLVPGLDKRTASRRVIRALSAVFFPAFFGGLFSSLAALDSPRARARYAAEIARTALAPLDTG